MNIYQLQDDLTRDEGSVPYAYQDSLGFWTIGIGHLIDKRMGGKLHDDVIALQFRLDIEEVIEELNDHLPWWKDLDEVRQRALANMRFNLGMEKLLQFKHMLDALKTGNWTEAVAQLNTTPWYHQVGKRADRIIHMFQTGTDP